MKDEIKIGELNNLLYNQMALLKVINVDNKFSRDDVDFKNIDDVKNFKCNTTLLIKVLNSVETFYLKLNYETNAGNRINTLNGDRAIYLDLIELNKQQITTPFNEYKPIHISTATKDEINSFYLDSFLLHKPASRFVSNKFNYSNKFNLLNGVEFYVTGRGVELDERDNNLNSLILLNNSFNYEGLKSLKLLE